MIYNMFICLKLQSLLCYQRLKPDVCISRRIFVSHPSFALCINKLHLLWLEGSMFLRKADRWAFKIWPSKVRGAWCNIAVEVIHVSAACWPCTFVISLPCLNAAQSQYPCVAPTHSYWPTLIIAYHHHVISCNQGLQPNNAITTQKTLTAS